MTRRDHTAEAFVRSLFGHHGRSMLAYAERLTGHRAVAEDVVQEALLLAWRHAEHLPAPEHRRGWLLAVIHRIAPDRNPRSHHREPRTTAPTTRADHHATLLHTAG
ncbi:sigma factor [Umezawaea sp. Da 62-37]|uniref:sigma factor n=1 Tax=Umezawaea sp. Da 62-37 TaxID=3075927 RepID=UPI0028F7151A|nr:sigma factor [Umezawaea sp. Da 62-37]WNV87297.1 sigma factor [Umezawaea sp. Da 62-37]